MVSPLVIFALVCLYIGVPTVVALLHFRASAKLTRAVRDELLSAIGALRTDLAVARFLAPPTSGGAAPAGGSPPSPPPAPVARKAVSVTRDDDPVHTRATVVAPPPVAAERKTPVGEGDAAPAAADRESTEELTQVWPAGKRPTMAMLPGGEPVPFPELTGSQDETPARGTPTKVSPGPAPRKPSR